MHSRNPILDDIGLAAGLARLSIFNQQLHLVGRVGSEEGIMGPAEVGATTRAVLYELQLRHGFLPGSAVVHDAQGLVALVRLDALDKRGLLLAAELLVLRGQDQSLFATAKLLAPQQLLRLHRDGVVCTRGL